MRQKYQLYKDDVQGLFDHFEKKPRSPEEFGELIENLFAEFRPDKGEGVIVLGSFLKSALLMAKERDQKRKKPVYEEAVLEEIEEQTTSFCLGYEKGKAGLLWQNVRGVSVLKRALNKGLETGTKKLIETAKEEIDELGPDAAAFRDADDRHKPPITQHIFLDISHAFSSVTHQRDLIYALGMKFVPRIVRLEKQLVRMGLEEGGHSLTTLKNAFRNLPAGKKNQVLRLF